jgi:predicted permease
MNLRYALRSIRKTPLITTFAVVSLAVGIGANSAIFSLIDQLLLRMLPAENPQELVQLSQTGPEIGAMWGQDRMSYPMYRDLRDKASAFSGVLAWYATSASLGHAGRTELIRSELVSGNYFQVLGVKAAIGRTFTPEDDDMPGAEPFVMLTYDSWKSRFGGDPNIVGRTINVNGYPMTIVGVAGGGFHGLEIGEATQVFIPIMMHLQINPMLSTGLPRPVLELRRSRWLNVFARLKPDMTITQAEASVAPLYRQIIEMEVLEPPFQRTSETTRQRFLASRMRVFDGSTGRSSLRKDFTKPLYVLMALTALVLLIACTNVANLLIARATARQREIAVRLALGADRTQIVAQLMLESLLLSAMAVTGGLGLAIAINHGLLRFMASADSQLTITGGVDVRVLSFSLAMALVTAFVFGLAPAIQAARPKLATTLKNEAGSIFGGRTHARVRHVLVATQVGVSLLLLIVSTLFVRTLSNLHQLDPGFRKDHVIAFAIDPVLNGYTPDRTAQFYSEMLDRIRTLPGVTGAAQAIQRVLAGGEWRNGITVEGYEPPANEPLFTHFNMVSPRYFETLGIPVLAGREFDTRDRIPDRATVAIVNETFARKYFTDGRALGRHIGMGNAPGTTTNIEIVGIVRDSKYDKLRGDTPAQMFVPLAPAGGTVVYVGSTGEPGALFGSIRAAIREMDPNLPLYGVRTLQDQVDQSLVTERLIATLSTAFASVATLLALIGLYGVMTYTVARRAREIGIRVSLGARAANVLFLMMREAVTLIATGLAIAIPLYIAVSHYIRAQLYGIEPDDPLHITAAAVFLLVIGLLAGYIPSRRALKVDPMHVLRYE